MKDLKGKKIGLSKSLNRIKNDWWRIQEHQGIELMLMMNDMTMDDIQLVEFPYAGRLVQRPQACSSRCTTRPTCGWQRDHKRDLAFRPLETALEKGVIDACYTQSGRCSSSRRRRASSRRSRTCRRYPDWRLQVANIPATITCTDAMAEKHPELAVAFMKGMIRVGRWANEHKRAAAVILDRQTFYRDVEATYEGIKPIDLVPNLSPQNLASVEIGKDFMLSHGYIKNDFDVYKWAAPEFLEQAARDLLEEQWKKTTTSKLPETAAPLSAGNRLG